MAGQVEAAAAAFFATGTCAPDTVAPPVLRSWQRCRAAGLTPALTVPPLLTACSPQDNELIALARPYLEDLYQYVEASGTALLLVNEDLLIVDLFGDPVVVDALAAVGVTSGVGLGEELVGTLAVNLAQSEGVPYQTSGFEHYASWLRAFGCAAAPLFAIGGGLLGAIAAVGVAADTHPHTLAMVSGTAQAIHVQLRNNLLLAESYDHLAALNAAIETISEGLLVLDAAGLVRRMNARAGALLGLEPGSAAGRELIGLIELPLALALALDRRSELADAELLFSRPGGSRAMLCSIRPVLDPSGSYHGALITLRPPESVQRLVQTLVGAQARFTFADIIGESAAMQGALRQARIAGNSRASALILGDVGVGKQLFAHAIHSAGVAAGGPFVELNCHAVSRALILSELLGHEGAQSGGQPGKFELAQGGTLVLGEVGALPLDVQTSLLRTIETRSLIRIGGQRVVPLDVRVIALSSRDLQREVAEGRFRAELYYRLNALSIRVPPLRHRGDDVLLLINHLLGLLGRRFGKQTLLAPDALAALLAYPWPGNVRELEAMLERLLTSTEKPVLTLADLPDAIVVAGGSGAPAAPSGYLVDRHAAAEREAILRAGRETAGHLGRTAERLGISRATLWRKMRLYGLSKEQFWQSTVSRS